MACTCIEEMNGKLAEHNTRIMGTICWPRDPETGASGQPYDTITIQTEKIWPRKRERASALATFCPFCGTRYVPETPST